MNETKETAVGSQRIALALTGAFGLVVVLAAVAWACTSSANISLSVNKGKPGVVVGVSGSEFPQNGRTRVYWEPNAGERQLLFEADSASFAQPVTIPEDAPAGTHYVKAYGYWEGDAPGQDQPAGTATASYTVSHGSVAGQISDVDGEGLHGAQVSVSTGGDVVGRARTDADGTYRVEDLRRGQYTLTAERPGYQSQSEQTEVRLGETSDVSFSLTRQSQDEPSDSSSGPSGEEPADGSQTSQPDDSQTSEPEGSQAPRGSEGAEPQPVESDQPEESPAQGTTLKGSTSGGPTPQESTAPEADGGRQASQPGQPAEEEPARQAVEPERERQSVGGDQPDRQTVGGADSTGGGDGDGEPAQAGPGGGDAPANQPQSVGEPQASSGAAQPSAGQPVDDEPASSADTATEELDTASEPRISEGPSPADEAGPEPEVADAATRSRPEGDASASPQTPSPRSGAADLWSGLDAGDVASLGSDQPATGQSSESDQALVLAVGLLGAGLLTLATGGTVAARRRRAPAEATSTPRSG